MFGVVSCGLRRRPAGIPADRRGIALQTVIIMVVLLVIAGAVAGVLITRGDEAVTDLERQNITQEASNFTSETLCKAAGYSWIDASNACTSP